MFFQPSGLLLAYRFARRYDVWFSNHQPPKPPDHERQASVKGLSFRVGPSGIMTYYLEVPGVFEARALANSRVVRIKVVVDKHGVPESVAIER